MTRSVEPAVAQLDLHSLSPGPWALGSSAVSYPRWLSKEQSAESDHLGAGQRSEGPLGPLSNTATEKQRSQRGTGLW